MREDINNKTIKYLVFMAFAVALFSILCMLTVWYVDPFFHYHKPLEGFPYIVDNQLTQNPGMAMHMDYDSVILGSSMTVNFNTDRFREELGRNTLKLSYSSAYPKDIANILDKVYAPYDDGTMKDIKEVFLGVDVITYSGDTDETKYPIPKHLYDKNVINDVKYLLNKDVLLDYILRPLVSGEGTDLARVYSSWWTDEYYNEDWVLRNHDGIYEKNPVKMGDHDFDEGIKKNLEVNITPYIEAHPETEFTVFFPPYSILFWNDVIMDNHLEATLNSYRCVYNELSGYENVRMFFFPAMTDTVSDLNNYADYTHYHPSVNEYMLKCFSTGEYLIDPSKEGMSIEDYIEKVQTMIDGYDFERIRSILDSYRN